MPSDSARSGDPSPYIWIVIVGLGAIAALVALFQWQMDAYESARLLRLGKIEPHRIVSVRQTATPTKYDVKYAYHATIVVDGRPAEIMTSDPVQPGDEVNVLGDRTRHEFRYLGPGGGLWSKLRACASAWVLALPVIAALIAGVRQLRHLIRFCRQKWTLAPTREKFGPAAEQGLQLATFVAFASVTLLVWLTFCVWMTFVLLEAPQRSALSTGLPLMFFTVAPFIPFVAGACWFRESRGWDILGNILFLGVTARVLFVVTDTLFSTRPTTGADAEKLLRELIEKLF